MPEPDGIDETTLTKNDPPQLLWIRVSDAMKLLWIRNPKLHDIGSVIESIRKHGLQELPKFDTELDNVSGEKGAIKAGNGRVEALYRMMTGGDHELPRGMAMDKDGVWVMPLLAGVDALSQRLAEAYAIDSNNLTLTGGDFTASELSRLWDGNSYMQLLQDMAADNLFPVSVPPEDLDYLIGGLNIQFPDYTQAPMQNIGVSKTFTVDVGDPLHLENALKQVKTMIDQHPEWQASIIL